MRAAKRKSSERSRRRAAKPRARASRTEKGAVGGIVGTLLSEHEFIHSLLDALQAESEKLAPRRVPDFHLLLEIVDYLVHFPDCYHHPREDLLFESLRQHEAGFGPQVERLQREHLTLHEHNAAMHELLRGIAAGKPVDRAELRQRINRYVSSYRQHMQFEAEEIFPRARGTLTAAQLRALEARTRFIDDPLFGSAVRDGYRRIARRVRAGAAELGGSLVATEVQALESMIDRLAGSVERFRKLRGSERGPGGKVAHERPATLLDRLRGNTARPSWQARMLNAVTRLTIKPLMKRGSVASMRATLARLDEQRRRFMPAEVRTEAVSTPGYDGEWVRLAGQRTRRVLLYFPGGGFILSAQNQHRLMLSRICREAQARGFLVHYRLAPETPFPGGLENCIAAYHGLLEQGVRAQDITLGGDSAGGGLVLSTLLALRDEGTALPARAFVLSPLGDLTYSGESRRYNSCRDPMLPTHRASQMHELYIGDALPGDRYISPVLADFDGLPPMLGQVGSTEILLDDTVRAAQQAQRAGVPFYLEVWQDMPHVFPIMGILPESEVAIARIAEFIRSGRLDELPARYGRSTPPPPPRWSLAALAG